MTDLPGFLAPMAIGLPILADLAVDLGVANEIGGGPAPSPQSNEVAGFAMTCQEELQWCWAAVTQSVEDWQNASVSQSSIASSHIDPNATGLVCAHPLGSGTTASLCPPCNRGCGEPHSLEAVLKERGRLRPSGATNDVPTFSEIETAVDNQRPLPVRIEWGGSGHFVCVIGYAVDAAGEEWVTVFDPLIPSVDGGPATDQDMRYSVFATAYPSTDGITTGTPNYLYEVQ